MNFDVLCFFDDQFQMKKNAALNIPISNQKFYRTAFKQTRYPLDTCQSNQFSDFKEMYLQYTKNNIPLCTLQSGMWIMNYFKFMKLWPRNQIFSEKTERGSEDNVALKVRWLLTLVSLKTVVALVPKCQKQETS